MSAPERVKRLAARFASVPAGYDANAQEEVILEFWRRERIFERSISQRPAHDRFVWYEGPPTANGKPGIHHVLVRVFKDLIPRYQTMRGRRVERKGGWDTHGLPVELQVEKQLGISGKPEIETLVPGDQAASIAKFNALCKESVWQYKDEWERLVARVGHWLDLDHPYVSYENDYIESVWWVLRQLWDKQLLYEDFKVVPYCPRCGTALSSHEVAQGYDETTDRSVYVKFKVTDQPATYLLAWTTTPWTLPGNLALAVGRDISYGRYKVDDSVLILADERAAVVLGDKAERIGPIEIDELVRLRYEPLFTIPALTSDQSYRVYPAEFVTTVDGTGIVHTAVMYGEDDFQLGSTVGLPKQHTVDLEGNFTAEVADFAGQFVRGEATEQALIDYLRDGGNLLKEEAYTHTYPFCWRCQSPLLYYAKQSWFIRMSALRDQLIASNATITWTPEHVRDGRFGEWLREVKDWALSRDRYWGTPLPVWRCNGCGKQECIGSLEQLRALSTTVPEDLHKPFIDDVRWPCPECGSQLERYPEVIDVWFDSGSMPYAQWHYPFTAESKTRVDDGQNYPADYIVEGLDQTRGWFYTLLAIATALGRPAPFRSVIATGLVLDKDGKKMSKSRGNVLDPWQVIREHGADALRFYFLSLNQPGDPKQVDPADITQVLRKTFLILWNTYSFFAQRVNGSAISIDRPTATTHVLDAWLVARTDGLVAAVQSGLDELNAFRASRAIGDYVTELSTWYLKHSRQRTDESFLPTFGWALQTLSLVLAPFAPFFAELLWQRLRSDADQPSVHLADWPAAQPVDGVIIAQMAAAQQYVELGLSARSSIGQKIRQPLRSAALAGPALTEALIEIVRVALNVKSVKLQVAAELTVQLDETLDDELRAEGVVRELKRAIQGLRKTAGLQPGAPATAVITGDHPLWSLIDRQRAELEASTGTSIQRGDPVASDTVSVDSLTVTLSKA